MGLRAVFAAALPDLFAKAGEPAVFTPATGAPAPCNVFIDFGVELQPAGAEAQVWQLGTTIEALLSETVREPNRGEIFTVYPDLASRTAGTGGTAYTVQAPLENDGLTVKVVVT